MNILGECLDKVRKNFEGAEYCLEVAAHAMLNLVGKKLREGDEGSSRAGKRLGPKAQAS